MKILEEVVSLDVGPHLIMSTTIAFDGGSWVSISRDTYAITVGYPKRRRFETPRW